MWKAVFWNKIGEYQLGPLDFLLSRVTNMSKNLVCEKLKFVSLGFSHLISERLN